MTPEQASGIFEFLLPQIQEEAATTRRVIDAVPRDKADYTPAEKNMTALKLAGHIASADVWFADSVLKGAFEMSGEDPADAFKSIDEVLAFYDANLPPAIEKLKALSGQDLAKVIDFFGMQFPNVTFLQVMIKHTVHHRGQLSAYLRPMGGRVPSIYGGSADEPFQPAGATA